MKINNIVLVSTTSDDISGASKALIELACALKERKLKVTVLLPDYGNLRYIFQKKGIKVKIFKEYSSWIKWKNDNKKKILKTSIKNCLNKIEILRIKHFFYREKPDLVHVNALTAYTVAKAAEEMNIPVIWHIREFMEEDLGIKFSNKSFALDVLNNATTFIAISKAIKAKWEKYIQSPIKVVYDGVPIDKYLVQTKKISNDTCKVILYGRFVKGKGQLFFLKGINKLIGLKKVNIQCYLAGKVEYKQYFDKCMKYIESQELQNIVKYLGEIDNIKELLSDKDIVSVCSKQEGFGRVTVEGMLGKCIVVAANSGASSEIIEDGKTGFLYQSNNIDNFADKMYEAIKNRTSKISENAQNYAKQQFSTQRNVDEIIKIYEKIGKNK